MPHTIQNITISPQIIEGPQEVITGTTYNHPVFPATTPKVIHVGRYSFVLNSLSDSSFKVVLQRNVNGAGWQGLPGKSAGENFNTGDHRRVTLMFHVPYYDGIPAGDAISYRLVASCETGTVSLHDFDGVSSVPSGVWKEQFDFEGEDTPPVIETWTLGTPAESLIYTGAINHNSLLIACARSGTGNRIMTSPDGINWTSRTSAGDYAWRRLATNGSIVVCVENAANGHMMKSTDGVNWSLVTLPKSISLADICHTGTSFIAVSNTLGDSEQVYRSLNGTNWSLIDHGGLSKPWYCVAAGGGVIVMLSSQGNAMYSVNDGLTWNTASIDNHSWQSVRHDGTRFIAVADGGHTAYGDGLSWATGPQLTFNNPEHIYHAHGQLLVCASDKSGNDIAVSTDHGASWAYQSTPTDAFWNCLTSNNDRFVCIGNIGVMTAEVS